MRSYNPKGVAVEFYGDRLVIWAKHGGFHKGQIEIVYAEVAKVVPYRNGRVFLHHVDRFVHHVNFRKAEDAENFAKLLYAFMVRSGSWPGDVPSPPAGRRATR